MNRKGFTLIELLIVVVIIGILAAIAIPKFANTKAKAYIASMKSDLRNLVTAEEAYFADSVKYNATTSCTTPPTVATVNFCVTTGNTLGTIGLAAGNGGWSVTITNTNLQTPLVTCAIFVNTATLAPAVSEGAPACQ
jgi:prepilin-type N-terminal cleavage/methylation domain-containing protein